MRNVYKTRNYKNKEELHKTINSTVQQVMKGIEMNMFTKLKLTTLLALAVSCSNNIFAAANPYADIRDDLAQTVAQAVRAQTTLDRKLEEARNASVTAGDAARDAQAQARQAATEIRNTIHQAEADLEQKSQGLVRNMGQTVQQELNQRVQPTVDQVRRMQGEVDRAKQEADRAAQQAQQQAQRAQQEAQRMNAAMNQKAAELTAEFKNVAIEAEMQAKRELMAEEAETKRQLAIETSDYETAQVKARKKAEFDFNEQNRAAMLKQKLEEQEAMLEGQKKLEIMKGDIARKNEEEAAKNPTIQAARMELEATKAAANRAAGFKAEVETAKIGAKSSERQLEMKLKGINKILGNIGSGLSDKKKMATITATVGASAALIYAAKHGLPLLFDYLVQPRVVSETSRRSMFGSTLPNHEATVEELTFTPDLQKALHEIANQLKTAQKYGENLPNVMFFGPPGTGKTAFAKAISRQKDAEGELIFDYALTSGSEFAKIKDLNIATGELRKLIRWGQKGTKPMIIFIDEAESLFTNRKLPTTGKHVTDFINSFLAMVQDKSQKNICFIFATNHPFKLDDAIINRIGKKVEFLLPGATELAKILTTYVNKFAKINPDSIVNVGQEFTAHLAEYAQSLVGSAPRDVKFVAEQMISRSRRTTGKPQLTDAIAKATLKEVRAELTTVEAWEKERNSWVQAQLVAAKA